MAEILNLTTFWRFTMTKENKITGLNMKSVHAIIGICIMFFGSYLPQPGKIVESSERLLNMGFPAVDGGVLVSISPVGMTVATIFFGVVYLWIFVDTFWPSILGFITLGFSNYAPMNAVIAGFFGNASTFTAFMLFLFCTALVKNQIANYFAQFLMTRKIVENRPWLMTSVLLLSAYLIASLDAISSMFIVWPVYFTIFNAVGLKKGDKYVTLMLVNSLIMILLCFSTDAIKGGSFLLLANLYAIADANPELMIQPIGFGSYMLFGVVVSMTVMVCLLAMMRYVFRVDVSPLKNFDIEVLLRNKLPPMTWKHKTLIFLLISYVFVMVLPGMLPDGNIIKNIITSNIFGWSTVLVLLTSMIHYKGEALADVPQLLGIFPWRVFFLTATAFLLGAAMTSPQTQVAIYMEYVLRDMFDGLSFFWLVSASVVVAIMITNFSNSIVAGIIFTPVLVPLCNAYGFNTSIVLTCFFFTVLIGAVTPAASPFAAVLFDNEEWISKTDVMRYAFVGSMLVVLVVILVGIPIASMLF